MPTKGHKPQSVNRDTPAMRQYLRFKERFPGCLLLFRMGDFYELFDDDAVTAAKALGLTLTERTSGIPMAGVPYHACESYVRRLIDHGYRVAVCDQVQDPKHAKGVVERAVTRVLTPGTLVDQSMLDEAAPQTLGCVTFAGAGNDPHAPAALAAVDLSTGAFRLVPCAAADLQDACAREGVRELLFAENADGTQPERAAQLTAALNIHPTPRPAWHFRQDESLEALTTHYRVASLAGFGLQDSGPEIAAAGAIIRYLRETQALDNTEPADFSGQTEEVEALKRKTLNHLQAPTLVRPTESLIIDAPSLRALEIERTIRTQSTEGSLLGLFLNARKDAAPRTAMGRRTLRHWLCAPARSHETITQRHDAVETLRDDATSARALAQTLDAVADIARIAARASLRRATPRDLSAFGRSLAAIEPLLTTVGPIRALRPWADRLGQLKPTLDPLATRINTTCVEHPPAHLRDGGLVRDGIDNALDDARNASQNAAQWLAEYQAKLIQAHDIPSLKVGFNKVFGYYIELPAAQARRAPDAFTRKQTLKNAERFITPELKDFEDNVLTAQERARERELAIFHDLCDAIAEHAPAAQDFAAAAAELDALRTFAAHARAARWTRPTLTTDRTLSITAGRHPVLEHTLSQDLVPNDTALATNDQPATLALITGPNMAGKSTYIRQVALTVILAHAGSFVPAESATIPLTDRVFTRIGADDALHQGQSTFMVEMVETANILNNATNNSLVVLDEVGRGTSTLDGLSLAWAIAESLAGVHNNQPNHPGTPTPLALFATHYHEITDLEHEHPTRITNLAIQTEQFDASDGPRIVFTHRIAKGTASQSFGVHVAQLAGLPAQVVHRADQLLATLAVKRTGAAHTIAHAAKDAPPQSQLGLFAPAPKPHPVVEELKALNIERLSPLDAFDTLRNLAAKTRNNTR